MRVGDILNRKSTRIVTVRMHETVGTAARLLRSENISALVVKDVCRTEGNVAVGMFSERDVVRAVAEHGPAALNMKISALISVQQLVSCQSADTLAHIRDLMAEHHIRHLPVIDDYTLIGVISMRDINAVTDLDAAAFQERGTAVPAFA
ncbi:CBS domain-containing protein [Bradyrhizobium sp. G127]|jgi:CBS domain-containing protein|uniref:CBS domain-containing protein n=1 Tax=Bradyrhizobium sp. G127 TaxID=2904800 RepID=UPI001F293821|nr:CBS domain-containing protein [Bradyrhizobium sp. G127]MCF2522492.1 CBS domain-containing protein [Bradyrhizobium sp. G127]